MNKSDVNELKRRFKKESCTISRISCCYVNSSKEKVCTFTDNFLSISEDEFHKYLEIAKKTLSGTLDNNLMELPFPEEAEKSGSLQHNLYALKKSGLEDEELIEGFFDHIISTYDFVGNYLIVLYYDNYDVLVKSTDNITLDESEETYEYIICSICPVMLSKPGLGYREDEHRIGSRIRDWIVGPVEAGFLFPCFTDRSSDVHSILTYSKKPDTPHNELWEMGLGCESKLTIAEKKNAFTNILTQVIGAENDDTKDIIVDIQSNLDNYIEQRSETISSDEEVHLKADDVSHILKDLPISEDRADRITKRYEEFFADDLPKAEELLDNKLLKDNELKIDKKNLLKEVAKLNNKLKASGVIDEDGHDNDIIVNVNPDKLGDIETTYLDGKKCIIIPINNGEKATINGESM